MKGSPLKTTVDTSPKAVEFMAGAMELNGRPDYAETLRALRTELTASEKLTRDERLRVARMLREHAQTQRRVAKQVEEANPRDNWASLSNEDEADDADALAAKVEA